MERASILEEAFGFSSDFWVEIMFGTAYGRCFGGGLEWFCVRVYVNGSGTFWKIMGNWWILQLQGRLSAATVIVRSLLLYLLHYCPSRRRSSARDRDAGLYCTLPLRRMLVICTINRSHVTCHYGTSRFGRRQSLKSGCVVVWIAETRKV